MATFRKQSFENQNVVVDGNTYEGCEFINCVIVFRGGDVPTFTRTTFKGVRIQLENGAGQTVRYLSDLSKAGLDSNVVSVMDKIQQGSLVKRQPEHLVAPAINTGTNYGQMGCLTVVMLFVTFIIIGALWYGMAYYPQAEVLNGDEARPLRSEIPLDLMPALPDDLAAVYDESRSSQLEDLASYRWIDESGGIVSIPIDAAIQLLLMQDDAALAMAGE